jgi:hypothetical protein
MATSMQAHEGHAIYSPSGELSNFLAGPKAGPDLKWQGLGPALCIAGPATVWTVVRFTCDASGID